MTGSYLLNNEIHYNGLMADLGLIVLSIGVKRQRPNQRLLIWTLFMRFTQILFAALTVAAHKLVYATSGVNKLRLTSVEGVRS